MIHDDASSVFNLLVQYQFSQSGPKMWHFSFQALYCPSVAVWIIAESVRLKLGASKEACSFCVSPHSLVDSVACN